MPDAERRRPLVAIDTNVFVGGLILQRGWPYLILEAWRANRLRLAISSSQYAELADVLQRDHIHLKYEITDVEIDQLLHRLEREVVPDAIAVDPVRVRDPDDAVILETAIENGAEFLVTGDLDLLEVAEEAKSRGISIVTPRQFAEHFILGGT